MYQVVWTYTGYNKYTEIQAAYPPTASWKHACKQRKRMKRCKAYVVYLD